LEELFLSGAEALYDGSFPGTGLRIGPLESPASRSRADAVCLEAEDLGELFRDWLGELLFLLEARNQRLKEAFFETLSETELVCLFLAEVPPVGADRTEIKAVTYHQLRVVSTRDGWEASVLFDI